MRNKNHFVCCTTDIRYDGRVYNIINTLAKAYPGDKVYVYNLSEKKETPAFSSPNIFYRKVCLLSGKASEKRLCRLINCYGYACMLFFLFLWKRPATVQVHHEGVLAAPWLYKFFFRRKILVFDDKELYHPHDGNIPGYLYKLETDTIRRADLVLFTNSERQRAMLWILKKYKIHNILVPNYVFNDKSASLEDRILKNVQHIREAGYKILLHQGMLSDIRGTDNIRRVIDRAPEDWKICFIGINEKEFRSFAASLEERLRKKIHNFGYIPYDQLNAFWKQADAAAMFYDACNFNNKFCAPNRLYLAVNNGIPIIGNADNHTLRTFLGTYRNGILIPPAENIDVFFQNYEVIEETAQSLAGKYSYRSNIIPELMKFYRSVGEI